MVEEATTIMMNNISRAIGEECDAVIFTDMRAVTQQRSRLECIYDVAWAAVVATDSKEYLNVGKI